MILYHIYIVIMSIVSVVSEKYRQSKFFQDKIITDSFKTRHSLEKRKKEFIILKNKYPSRIPVIVEKQKGSDIPDIDKHNFLVPEDLTIGQFMYVIRKRIKLAPERAIFIFVNNQIPTQTLLMNTLHQESRDNDGFLYVTYTGENVFGIFCYN